MSGPRPDDTSPTSGDGPGNRRPPPNVGADAVLLAAYLRGDLTGAEADALEERLGREPQLAARLDAEAGVLAALRGVDEVAVPPGFGRRLRDRLAAERAAGAGPGAQTRPEEPESGWDSQPRLPHVREEPGPDAEGPLEDQAPGAVGQPDGSGQAVIRALRRPRSRGGPRWAAVGAAAAAGVAALGLVSLGVVQGIGSQDADEAALQQASDAPAAAPEADVAEEGTPQEATPHRDEAPSAGEAAPDAAPSPLLGDGKSRPVVLDEGIALADETALRDRYADLPEVAWLLGAPASAATAAGPAYRAEVAAQPSTPGGRPPTACLDEAQAQAPAPSLPARVESVVYGGRPAVAYLLVAAGDEALLDTVVAVLVDPSDCSALARVPVS